MENLNKSIDELVNTIINSKEYKNVVQIKEKMNNNKGLISLITEVKNLQKKYIKRNYDEKIKQELEKKEEELNNIPIYSVYNENLKVVNEMISLITDELNNYFYEKLNNLN